MPSVRGVGIERTAAVHAVDAEVVFWESDGVHHVLWRVVPYVVDGWQFRRDEFAHLQRALPFML